MFMFSPNNLARKGLIEKVVVSKLHVCIGLDAGPLTELMLNTDQRDPREQCWILLHLRPLDVLC